MHLIRALENPFDGLSTRHDSIFSSPTAPTIRTREQLDAVVENIVRLQLEQGDLLDAQENEIAAVREKYRVSSSRWTVSRKWKPRGPRRGRWPTLAAFDERLLDCPHATIGFRETSPRVERASRKWTWTAAALKLAESEWGRRYLRIPSPEVDKEALLADQPTLSAEELRQAGIKIVQGERFFAEPHPPAENEETPN